MKILTIGQIARQAEVGVETIRFYEREGLLEPPERRASGYRQYSPEAIARLRFIKQAQRHGFTLKEIRELLSLRLQPGATRAEVKSRVQAKIQDIEARIAELKRMKKSLEPLMKACDGKGSLEGCPILQAFACHHELSRTTN